MNMMAIHAAVKQQTKGGKDRATFFLFCLIYNVTEEK
jgi:hypothetical protein